MLSVLKSINAYNVEVAGTLAYVANGLGVRVVDVSNPAALTPLGSLDTPGFAWDVEVVGSLIYVGQSSGLQ